MLTLKKQSENHGIKKGDVILLAVLCLICAFLFVLPFFKSNKESFAVITLDGETVDEFRLSPDEKKTIQVGGCTIRSENSVVYFESADCPDKLCVKSGKLSRPGDTAACVPNKVVVTIRGKSKNNYDMVAF